MPALFAPLVGFLVGVLLAVAVLSSRRAEPPAASGRALAIVALFAGLVFAPVCGYFLTYSPDWAFAYLIDTRHVSSALLLVVFLLSLSSVPLGFLVALSRAQGRRPLALLPWTMVPMAAIVTLFVVLAPKLMWNGSYAQVRQGLTSLSLIGSPLGYSIAWIDACLLAGVAWAFRELRRG